MKVPVYFSSCGIFMFVYSKKCSMWNYIGSEVMAVERNPYVNLVQMLERRLSRQRSALLDTESQLEGARESAHRWDVEQRSLPLEAPKPKAVK